MEKRYEIGGKTYIQRPIVLGQFAELAPMLSGLTISTQDSAKLIADLGSNLPRVMAVVLVEEGKSLPEAFRSEAIQARANHLAWNVQPEQVIEVVEDFFECTPVSSISTRLGAMMQKLKADTGKDSTSSLSSTHLQEELSSTGPLPSGE